MSARKKSLDNREIETIFHFELLRSATCSYGTLGASGQHNLDG